VPRDPQLVAVEAQLRMAIRDAVNRPSRKPFCWGGLTGYQQLTGLAQALSNLPSEAETSYLHRLAFQVNRVLEKNRRLAQDVAEAYRWFGKIAACLRYPPSSFQLQKPPTGAQVCQEMETLLHTFQPNLHRQPAQAALYRAWHRLWKTCGTDLLPCYDLVGLPPDNLQLEACFAQLRHHQRRISGCQSTRPLRDFGQFQVLFDAHSETELLHQIQQVSRAEYRSWRQRLALAEAPRQTLCRFHRDPLATAQHLIAQHAARRAQLTCQPPSLSP
jgi:uncharacterized protein YecE (DUF72 family)